MVECHVMFADIIGVRVSGRVGQSWYNANALSTPMGMGKARGDITKFSLDVHILPFHARLWFGITPGQRIYVRFHATCSQYISNSCVLTSSVHVRCSYRIGVNMTLYIACCTPPVLSFEKTASVPFNPKGCVVRVKRLKRVNRSFLPLCVCAFQFQMVSLSKSEIFSCLKSSLISDFTTHLVSGMRQREHSSLQRVNR